MTEPTARLQRLHSRLTGGTSLAHATVATVLPRLRLPRPRLDDATLREQWTTRHTQETAQGHRPLPTRWVRGFTQRFDLAADDSAGFRTWIYSPTRRDVRRTVLYLHGGYYVAGIDPFHLAWTTKLAERIGARIVLPDYPLAPEATWRDSHAALLALTSTWAERAEQHDEAPLVLAGDSAGGGYALSVALGVRDAGGPQPGHLVMHAPWVDLSRSTPETTDFQEVDPWLNIAEGDIYARWWAGEDDLQAWQVSPLFGDLAGLPPALQLYGTRDLLTPGCRLLQRRADEAGWDLTSIEEPGLLHVYGLFPGFVPEARRAFTQVLDFIGEGT